jgi:hypothetical protein
MSLDTYISIESYHFQQKGGSFTHLRANPLIAALFHFQLGFFERRLSQLFCRSRSGYFKRAFSACRLS